MASAWLPKPGGGVRRMAELSDRDARRWHRLGGRIAAAVEPRLDPRVLGNRAVVPGSTDPAWRLHPVAPSLRRARRAARALTAGAAVVLRTDVAEFYPSVTPGTLARALAAAGVKAEDARLAADMVDAWGSEGYAGLPIGPPASAVVGNAVLRDVDEALARLPFIRWADDVLVALPSARAADRALQLVDEALAAAGLRRNGRKTSLDDRPDRWLRPGGGSIASG